MDPSNRVPLVQKSILPGGLLPEIDIALIAEMNELLVTVKRGRNADVSIKGNAATVPYPFVETNKAPGPVQFDKYTNAENYEWDIFLR